MPGAIASKAIKQAAVDTADVQTIADVLLRRTPPYSPAKREKAISFAELWLQTWAEHAALMDRQSRAK